MNKPLRGCPTCGTRVSEDTKLGMRDYRWVAKHLPGRVAPSDIDGVLEASGHFLIMEYKPPGVALPMGQRIMLRRLVKMGAGKVTVLVVWGDGIEDDDPVEFGELNSHGDVPDVISSTAGELGQRVGDWFVEHAA